MPNLTPSQRNALQELWLGGRLFAWREARVRDEGYSQVWTAIVVKANGSAQFVREPFPLISMGLVKVKWRNLEGPDEYILTDAGAQALGHDVEGTRKVVKE